MTVADLNSKAESASHISGETPSPLPQGSAKAKQGGAEKARQAVDGALAELVAALEAGKSDALKAYLSAVAKFHRYSFSNCMLIASQRPDASRVAGFKAWRKLGRFVRKGERGIVIIAPIVRKRLDGEQADPEARDGYKMAGFRAAYVFDIGQTDGEDLPDLGRATGEPGEHLAALETFIRGRGIDLGYVDSGEIGGALGVSKGGSIRIAHGQSEAERFAALAHEMAHELLHKVEDRKNLSKAQKETEAEAVAYAVGQAAGLVNEGASADYIQLWDGSAEVLAQILQRIRDAAAEILDGLDIESSDYR